MKRALRAVEAIPEGPPPDLSYEHRERSYVLSRDWARVHVEGDRRPPLPFFASVRRTWL